MVSSAAVNIPRGVAGVDVGATLSKLAFRDRELALARLPSRDAAGVLAMLSTWNPRHIAATGGGAGELGTAIGKAPVLRIDEFRAWAAGAPIVAAAAGVALPSESLLVSLGTGTSVLALSGGSAHRVGGSALGGGTLLGLGQLLTTAASFPELAALAGQGDRRSVDLLVGDIYREGGISLPRELNAASFGKLASQAPADLAHALMGLVGENVAIIATALARAEGIQTVVYCGSTLEENPALEGVLAATTRLFGKEPLFLPQGAFCGAVGAAALAG